MTQIHDMQNNSQNDNQAEVAIIQIHGSLMHRADLWDELQGCTSYAMLQSAFTDAINDDCIGSIILDVDSPGGDVSGLFDLADLIYNSRSIKPIWAVANEAAYSAAYVLASSAEKVFLSRTAGVGSIGVVANHINQAGLDEKLGLGYTTVFAGAKKDDFTPHQPLSEAAQSSLQKEVDRLYELLIETVARNRGLSTEQIRHTQAALFFGADAVNAGLADSVMTISDLLQPLSQKRKPTMTTERDDYRKHVLALAKACELAGRPDQLVEFIEQDVSVDAAKDKLMGLLAAHSQQTMIQSHVAAVETKPPENPVIEAAKQRRRIS